jgi:hypothetical protein
MSVVCEHTAFYRELNQSVFGVLVKCDELQSMSTLSSHFCKPLLVWASQLSWLQRAMKFRYAIVNSSSFQQLTSLL